ncbi:unnamed protein product [Amoebophrya sp. A120]|nr:unnamed protein product [Amoebophrya sp. A120]|eukprot:GSA120T00023337001.1
MGVVSQNNAEVVLSFRTPIDTTISSSDEFTVSCVNDFASCNNKCNIKYGHDPAKLEACKISTAKHFLKGGGAGFACFWKGATVEVADCEFGSNARVVELQHLRPHQFVRTGEKHFEPVLGFLHRDLERECTFVCVRVESASGRSETGCDTGLYLTPGHLVFARESEKEALFAKPAIHLRPNTDCVQYYCQEMEKTNTTSGKRKYSCDARVKAVHPVFLDGKNSHEDDQRAEATEVSSSSCHSRGPPKTRIGFNQTKIVHNSTRRRQLLSRSRANCSSSFLERPKVGIVAPLTFSGQIIVNNVLCSCYADIPHHPFCHMLSQPFRMLAWKYYERKKQSKCGLWDEEDAVADSAKKQVRVSSSTTEVVSTPALLQEHDSEEDISTRCATAGQLRKGEKLLAHFRSFLDAGSLHLGTTSCEEEAGSLRGTTSTCSTCNMEAESAETTTSLVSTTATSLALLCDLFEENRKLCSNYCTDTIVELFLLNHDTHVEVPLPFSASLLERKKQKYPEK